MNLNALIFVLFFFFGDANAYAKDKDRLITFRDAQGMMEKAKENSSFPLVINDQVLIQMNETLATRSGRATWRKALVAMENHRAQIEAIFREKNLPFELLALPIVESGYRNLPASASPYRTAGLWQFLKSTARGFGLRVNKNLDERLHVERSTKAAATYLRFLYEKFKDWHLALVAYNQGENAVDDLLQEANSRDPWQLAREKKITPYLARVMVAMIVLNNPDLLN